MNTPAVSVVIPTHNEGRRLGDTIASIVCAARSDYEVVVVDDGSTDTSVDEVRGRFHHDPVSVVASRDLGVARARNRGAEAARGDVVVFVDAHCFVRPGAIEGLAAALEDPAVGLAGPAIGDLSAGGSAVGCGLTFTGPDLNIRWLPRMALDAYTVPLASGCCQALRRADFLRWGGFDPGMTRWGAEDLEICLRVALTGLDVVVEPRSEVFHLFRDQHPYHVETPQILHNQLRLAFLHLSVERFERVVDHYRNWPAFPAALSMLLTGDAMAQRARLERSRQRDDDWFCERFHCTI
jgi:glycosyltransferase involved in cell wall biosynthesis